VTQRGFSKVVVDAPSVDRPVQILSSAHKGKFKPVFIVPSSRPCDQATSFTRAIFAQLSSPGLSSFANHSAYPLTSTPAWLI